MKVKPIGFYVLVEMDSVEEKTESGIYIGDQTREQAACEFGIIKAIGPVAYLGFPGCDPREYPNNHHLAKMQPHEIWGVNVGDRVEYRRYEGKESAADGTKNLRYIPDSHIIGVVSDE